jgi:acetolactate synthase I/II/III large subunit
MAEKGIQPIGVDLWTPDFLAIAKGYGCAAERATSLEHLRALLDDARARDVPSLIEIREDAPFLAV